MSTESKATKLLVMAMLFLMGSVVGRSEEGRSAAEAPRPQRPTTPRSRQANLDLIDLSKYYTASLDDDWLVKPGANLASLPKGVQGFAHVAFDVRGLIQLAGKKALAETGIDFPQVVKGIGIRYKAGRLHFLQGAARSADEDTKIGEYVLHYANNRTRSMPIVYQRNAKDWWVGPNDKLPTEAGEAWRGSNPSTRHRGYHTHLLKYTWENLLPREEISTIDFASNLTEAWPFLVAKAPPRTSDITCFCGRS
ncbi:MAG: hypothetical protein JW955_00385 [Sedimentisphaerales bacterium]|nr:hypothetical protein [Sedimentisphaerales bacterium]